MQPLSPSHADPAPGRSGSALTEMRFAGRGGQGVITAGELLGTAVLRSGRHAQSLPTFGPERRGALAQCTLRVADEPIQLKCSSASPSVLVCLDPTIWRYAPITLGLQEDAILVVNTKQSAVSLEAELRSGRFVSTLEVERCSVSTLDATGIALDTLGRPISNTAMLGAVAGATNVVGLEDLDCVLRERFGAAGEINVTAAHAAFRGVRGEVV